MINRWNSALAGLALAAALPGASSLAQQSPRPAPPPTFNQPTLQTPGIGQPPQAQPPRPAAPPAAQAPAPAAPPAAQAAPSAASQPAQDAVIPIPNATASHLEAARELVIRSGLSKSFDGAIPDMMRQLNGNVTRTRPELINDMKASLEKLQPEFMKLTEDMISNAARIYTAVMSEQECKDAVAFFRSPIGTKFIFVQPIVFGNIADVMEPWRKHIAQRMMDMVREDMKAKGKPI